MVYLCYKLHICYTLFQVVLLCGISLSYGLNKLANNERYREICLSVSVMIATYSDRNLLFLAEEFEKSSLADTLLKLLDKPKIILNSSNFTDEEGLFILFGHKGHSYQDFLGRLTLTNNLRFLIIWLQPDAKFINIQIIFNEFWSFEIANAVALVEMKYNGIYIYTYYPYTATRCSDSGPPVFLDSWNSSSKSFVRNVDVFAPKKLLNLQACPLQCSGTHIPPDSIITKQSNNTYRFSGLGGLIFKFVAQNLNFTPVINRITDTTNSYEGAYSNETSVMAKDIIARKVDIGFGKFSRSVDLHKDIMFAKETGVDCFTWAVPFRAGQTPSMWNTYVDEFFGITWVLIVLSFFAVVASLFVLAHLVEKERNEYKSFSYTILFVLSTFLGSQLKLTPRNNVIRILVIHWLLYSLVIIAAYQASLGSIVTVPVEISNLQTINDILETNLGITGSPQMYYVLNASTSSTKQISTLLKRFEVQPPGEILPVMKKVVEDRNTVVFANQRLLMYLNSKLKDTNITDSSAHVMTECLIRSPSSPMLLRRGSPYQIPIDILLTRLLESGIIEHWSSLNQEEERNSRVQFIQLSFLHMKGAFTVLFYGNCSAMVVFILEHIFHKWIHIFKDSSDNNEMEDYPIPFTI